MRIHALLLSATMACVGIAAGAPLDPRHVPAEATWLAHLDVDALRTSTLAERAYQTFLVPNEDVKRQLADFRKYLELDLTTDVHGITVYGRRLGNLGKNEGVVIGYLDIKPERLQAFIRVAPDHRTRKYRSFDLHLWTDAKGKPNEHRVVGAIFSPAIVVIGSVESDVQAALDVLEGQAASLAAKSSPLGVAVPRHVVGVARAHGLADAGLPFKSPMVTQCEAFSLMIGEQDGEVLAEARLTTKSAELATHMKAIVEGLRAMGELQCSADPDMVKLLRRIKTKTQESSVEVEIRAPVDEVWKQLLKGVQTKTVETKQATE